ncbi:7784_t:CDS:2 [Dentiscutata heterogama]|uniref:7784_t:CDS:1 n=1 Tax=Dentiscutata heterogama TaxID=1316150 RepID=A0ACA9NY92_9GLOM|nr:7784_t:CDS:2 [Dentiscutata heterogama]
MSESWPYAPGSTPRTIYPGPSINSATTTIGYLMLAHVVIFIVATTLPRTISQAFSMLAIPSRKLLFPKYFTRLEVSYKRRSERISAYPYTRQQGTFHPRKCYEFNFQVIKYLTLSTMVLPIPSDERILPSDTIKYMNHCPLKASLKE